MASIVSFIKDALAPSYELFIKLKKNSFWEGDIIEGEITAMSVEYPYDARITVELKGEAKACDVDTNDRFNEAFLSESKTLFYGQITERARSFPFKFTLPKQCQSSFKYKGSDGYASIEYSIGTSLKSPTKLDQFKQQNFRVKEKQKEPTAPMRGYTTETFFMGSLGIGVWLDRTAFFRGDRIVAMLKVNKNNDISLPPIGMRLVHAVEFKDKGVRLSDQAYVTQIAPPPNYFYGAMWMTFNIHPDIELSSHGPLLRSRHYLWFDLNGTNRLAIPITILAQQELWSLHPIAPPIAPLPPTVLYRPPYQPKDTTASCSLCGVDFGILKQKKNCRHCGKVFCTDCVPSKTAIAKLKYTTNPVQVCRPCARVVEETGGVKYQSCKKVIEDWRLSTGVHWVPKCSKKAFEWEEVKFVVADTKVFAAVSSVKQA